MDKYVLKNKSGEVIHFVYRFDKESAIEYFCQIKKLSREDLIKIYSIEIEW